MRVSTLEERDLVLKRAVRPEEQPVPGNLNPGTRTLWRISNHSDLVGLGGERSEGRWHTAALGKRIVYLSEHPALALIETLANLKGNPHLFPDSYQLMKVSVAASLLKAAGSEPRLPDTWRSDTTHTQRLGDAWLGEGRTALLCVPSAPAPESRNYLLNPLHPEARSLRIDWARPAAYDKRLFHLKRGT